MTSPYSGRSRKEEKGIWDKIPPSSTTIWSAVDHFPDLINLEPLPTTLQASPPFSRTTPTPEPSGVRTKRTIGELSAGTASTVCAQSRRPSTCASRKSIGEKSNVRRGEDVTRVTRPRSTFGSKCRYCGGPGNVAGSVCWRVNCLSSVGGLRSMFCDG